MPPGSPETPRTMTTARALALSVCASVLSASCHPKAAVHPPRNMAVSSALEECLRASGYKAEPAPEAPSPTVLAAARQCFAKYVRKPTIERWAAHLRSTITSELLRQGERLFVDSLRKC